MDLEDLFKATKPGDVGIFGDPIDHSLSPVMHNAAFKTWQGSFRDNDEKTPEYHKFLVKENQLEQAVKLARQYKLRGFNATIPHKIRICDLLDELDPFAKKVGAVNTVANISGKFKGFNTDGEGYQACVHRDMEFDFEGKNVLVLGAGGTGRVVAAKSFERGANVLWWNRSPGKISEALKTFPEMRSRVKALNDENAIGKEMENIHLVVNTTSVGLKPNDGMPVKDLKFHPGQFAFDVIYNRETRFLQEAQAAGATVAGGMGMLVYQGAHAFGIWVGRPAPKEIMWHALTETMKKEQ